MEYSIDDLILTGRFSIIEDELEKHNTSGSKLSKLVGISLDELYDWYFRGKDGEEKFEEFSLMFELGVILPRVLAVNHAKGLGVAKNKLHKKLKKDIGVEEYKIWQKTGIIDKRNLNVPEIKNFGSYEIKVNLGMDVSAYMTVNVCQE